MIEEPNLGQIALRIIDQILSNKNKYLQMQKAALEFSKPEAAKAVARDILNI